MNAIQKAVHNLGESLTALGKQFTEESFIFWAEESQDKKYVESHTFHKMLELRLVVHQHIDISKEVAKALIDSDSFLCDMMTGDYLDNTGESHFNASKEIYEKAFVSPNQWLKDKNNFKLILK